MSEMIERGVGGAMSEQKKVRYAIRHYAVVLMCDETEICPGEMVCNGCAILTSMPPQFPHRCDRCGREAYVRGAAYPYVMAERIGAPLALDLDGGLKE